MAKHRDYRTEANIYHKRIVKLIEVSNPAVKLWQKEQGKPLTWPDLVELIKWLTSRCQIIPRREKMVRVKAWAEVEVPSLGLAAFSKPEVKTRLKPCTILISAKYLKGGKR